MKFQTYEKYKPSGVEWLGNIPEEWNFERFGDKFYLNKKKNLSLLEKNLLSLSYGKIIREDINSNFGLLPASFDTYQIVQNGCIILRLTDLQNDKKSLRVGQVKENGMITSAYIGLILSRQLYPTFIYYLLHTYDIIKVFYWQGGSLRQSMKYDDIKVLPLAFPEKNAQIAIANYLDKKTILIDKKIELLEKKKGKYQELKQTLINELVTKGLDKNVKMKESGIEWIGKIPKHWEVVRGKNVFLENSKSKITANEGEASGKYKFFSSSNKQTKWLDYYTEEAESILFSTGGSAGIHYCKQEYSYSTDTWSAYCTNKSHLKYYYYYFESILYEIGIIGFRGSGLEHLQKDFIKLSELPCPPKQEQITITKYLDKKTQKIDTITKTIDKNIGALKEFRKTLINDVVTGKVKVV